MSDVLISYASRDRPQAEKLANELARLGFSVWWDRNIPPGKKYEDVIKDSLKATKCVLALWSKKSVNSDWVKAEAEAGAKRNILIPVLIEKVELPIGFTRIQAADLTNWKPQSKNQNFEQLLAAVESLTGRKRKSKEKPAEKTKRKAKTARKKIPITPASISMVAIVSILVFVLGYFLWPVPDARLIELSLNLQGIYVDNDGANNGAAIWKFDILKDEKRLNSIKDWSYDDEKDESKPAFYGIKQQSGLTVKDDESFTLGILGHGPDGQKARGQAVLKWQPSRPDTTISILVLSSKKGGRFIFELKVSEKKFTAKR